jgi:5-methylcytosine-specific restriction protein A
MPGWPYVTARWKRLRLMKLGLEPLCEYCPADRRNVANTVDHAVPIRDGGAIWSLDNLRSCCAGCHSAKTARGVEAGAVRTTRPRKGCRADGTPLDPAHPWAQADGSS